jgi:hypothetical protein
MDKIKIVPPNFVEDAEKLNNSSITMRMIRQ